MERRVIDFRNADFLTTSVQGTPQDDISWHNFSWVEADDTGFFLVKFRPGVASIPHKHLGFEETIILESELRDRDGFAYRQGDCVSIRAGSKRHSTSHQGAIVGVFVRGGFQTITDQDL